MSGVTGSTALIYIAVLVGASDTTRSRGMPSKHQRRIFCATNGSFAEHSVDYVEIFTGRYSCIMPHRDLYPDR